MITRQIIFNQQSFQVQIRDEADDSVLAEIFKHREYRATEKIIRATSDPIIDVGAHAGFFTLYCRALNPTIPIYALEPEPANQTCINEQLVKNKITNVTLIKAALTGETGQGTLALTPDSHNHYILTKKNSGTEPTIIVPTLHFADVIRQNKIKRVGLLKIDIEGGEYAVFKSLRSEDFAYLNAIIMEYHNQDQQTFHPIEQQLREQGFGVQIFPSKFDKQMGFLFARNKRNS